MRTSKTPISPRQYWAVQVANLAAAAVNAVLLIVAHTPISLIGLVNVACMAGYFLMFTPRKDR
ncbi:hypothetical protein BJD60_gp53 [Gordonia phage Schnabeltier]|uniref:Uncharacterized protein n=1 Tax=Gordonia phage Schnabeltier TaxID=1821561 RepID=A0A142KA41_9CAUD|nr:hypothetical protein BJD60_gp53 [Gordonia phage Schnabeltier]AMS02974.1 hypothetical protein SEA_SCHNABELTIER_53 [Gordonia phage Schnabeltier]